MFRGGLDPRFAVVARPTVTAARSGLEWLDTETGHLFPLMPSESALSYPSVSADGTRVAYTTGTSTTISWKSLWTDPPSVLFSPRVFPNTPSTTRRAPLSLCTRPRPAEGRFVSGSLPRWPNASSCLSRIFPTRRARGDLPPPSSLQTGPSSHTTGTSTSGSRRRTAALRQSSPPRREESSQPSGPQTAPGSPSTLPDRPWAVWSRFVSALANPRSGSGRGLAVRSRQRGRLTAHGSRAVVSAWDSTWYLQTAASHASSARNTSLSPRGRATRSACM